MVEYKLISESDTGLFLYEYWIECKDEHKGLASLDPGTGKATIILQVEGGFGWHEEHLLFDLTRKWKAGDKRPQEGCVARY